MAKPTTQSAGRPAATPAPAGKPEDQAGAGDEAARLAAEAVAKAKADAGAEAARLAAEADAKAKADADADAGERDKVIRDRAQRIAAELSAALETRVSVKDVLLHIGELAQRLSLDEAEIYGISADGRGVTTVDGRKLRVTE